MAKTPEEYDEEVEEALAQDAEARKELEDLVKRGLWEAVKALIKSLISSIIPAPILDIVASWYSDYEDDGDDDY